MTQLGTLLLIVISIIFFACHGSPAIKKVNNFQLDTLINPDTAKIRGLVSEKKNVILVFKAWNYMNKDLLDLQNLANPEIFNRLQKYTIIELYVDDKTRIALDNSTVGQCNMAYQRINFNSCVQPFMVLYKDDVEKCNGNVYPIEKEVLNFFKKCN